MIVLVQLLFLLLVVSGLVALLSARSGRPSLPGTPVDVPLLRGLQEELEAVRERLARAEERIDFLEGLLQPPPQRPALPPRPAGEEPPA